MRFDDQVVVLAGGGSGIGRAAAGLFVAAGARVVVADVDLDGGRETVARCGDRAQARRCDVTDYDQCRRLVDDTVAEFGRLDVLVTTVGWTDVTPFLTEHPDYWQRILRVNLLSAMYLTHAAATHMTIGGAGSIVLTSSDAGKSGMTGETAYSGAKAGVIGFIKGAAREFARHNVRINGVAPGPTLTPMIEAQGEDMIERIRRAVPMRRLAEPHEPAQAILFLASDHASHITGQTLSVSGGLTMSS